MSFRPSNASGGTPFDGFGLVQIFTGDGKGKTSAALGTALRTVAIGKRAAVVCFDKGGTQYSERALADRLPDLVFFPTGLDRIDPVTKQFRFGVTDEDRKEGERGLAIVRDLFRERAFSLVVLDEICSSAALGIVREEDALAVLDAKPPDVELILTGRDAPASFHSRADLVTDMRMVKHYYSRGEAARRGLDF